MKRLDRIKSAALRAASHRITFVVLIVSLSLTGVIFARHYRLKRATPAPAAAQAEGPSLELIEIRNQTQALEVVSKKIDNNTLQLEFRNKGQRPIIAYRIDIRADDRFVMDLSVGNSLAPSRTVHTGIPLPKLAFDKQSRTYPVIVSMALFTDGTGEGDQSKIDAQRDQMIGQAAAMSNMSELVRKLRNESELLSEQFAQKLSALKMLAPANFNREQTAGYMAAIRSMQTKALVLNKLSANQKAGGIDNFKNAFIRQLSNLKMIKQEVKQ